MSYHLALFALLFLWTSDGFSGQGHSSQQKRPYAQQAREKTHPHDQPGYYHPNAQGPYAQRAREKTHPHDQPGYYHPDAQGPYAQRAREKAHPHNQPGYYHPNAQGPYARMHTRQSHPTQHQEPPQSSFDSNEPHSQGESDIHQEPINLEELAANNMKRCKNLASNACNKQGLPAYISTPVEEGRDKGGFVEIFQPSGETQTHIIHANQFRGLVKNQVVCIKRITTKQQEGYMLALIGHRPRDENEEPLICSL